MTAATRARIDDLAERIATAFRPERIVLFGSFAYGSPTPDSDVDLLVVVPCVGKPWRKAAEIRYPGRSSDREDARVALKAAEGIRSASRQVLGLPEKP